MGKRSKQKNGQKHCEQMQNTGEDETSGGKVLVPMAEPHRKQLSAFNCGRTALTIQQ